MWAVLGPGDDLVLDLPGQVGEISGVSGNPDCKPAMFLRVLLRIEKCLFIDNVDLQVHAAQIEVRSDQRAEYVSSLFPPQVVGMEFDVNLDYGYGSGGPHITPDKSMQQLVWSEMEVSGGRRIRTKLKRPSFSYEKQVKAAWLKSRGYLNPKVLEMLEEVDSYRDVAVIAIPLPSSKEGQAYRIPDIENYNGLHWKTDLKPLSKLNVPEAAVIPSGKVIDLSEHMQKDVQSTGRRLWETGRFLGLAMPQTSR